MVIENIENVSINF